MQTPRRFSGPLATVTAGSVTGAAGNPITYHGGPVLESVEVVPIYWGAAWTSPSNTNLISQLDSFFDFLVSSPLVDMLAEYGPPGAPIGRGRRILSVSVPGSEPGSANVVSDSQIQQQVQTLISSATVPPVTANSLYFVFLPPGVACVGPDGGASCVKFCGYHSNLGSIFYAVIPFIDCAVCRIPGATLFDSLAVVISHELCEAITNPASNAWHDPSGDEIADVCAPQTARLGNFLVQRVRSNAQDACVIAPPGVGP